MPTKLHAIATVVRGPLLQGPRHVPWDGRADCCGEMANARHILARGSNHLPDGPHLPHAGQRFASPDDVVVQGTPA